MLSKNLMMQALRRGSVTSEKRGLVRAMSSLGNNNSEVSKAQQADNNI
jgi:hypothetical protein